jgi:hypothetical protein
MQEWIVPLALGVLALLVLVLVVAHQATRSRTRRELLAAQAEAAFLRKQVEEIQLRLAERDRTDYVITRLGEEPAEPAPVQPPGRIDGSLFADLLLRESVVKAAALVHGVRRGLAPEVRNRIRFEVRREVKRARRARRAETREARREWEARQRAEDAA